MTLLFRRRRRRRTSGGAATTALLVGELVRPMAAARRRRPRRVLGMLVFSLVVTMAVIARALRRLVASARPQTLSDSATPRARLAPAVQVAPPRSSLGPPLAAMRPRGATARSYAPPYAPRCAALCLCPSRSRTTPSRTGHGRRGTSSTALHLPSHSPWARPGTSPLSPRYTQPQCPTVRWQVCVRVSPWMASATCPASRLRLSPLHLPSVSPCRPRVAPSRRRTVTPPRRGGGLFVLLTMRPALRTLLSRQAPSRRRLHCSRCRTERPSPLLRLMMPLRRQRLRVLRAHARPPTATLMTQMVMLAARMVLVRRRA